MAKFRRRATSIKKITTSQRTKSKWVKMINSFSLPMIQKANETAILLNTLTTFWFRFVNDYIIFWERILSVNERHKKPPHNLRRSVIIIIVIVFHRPWALSYRRPNKKYYCKRKDLWETIIRNWRFCCYLPIFIPFWSWHMWFLYLSEWALVFFVILGCFVPRKWSDMETKTPEVWSRHIFLSFTRCDSFKQKNQWSQLSNRFAYVWMSNVRVKL